MAEYFLVAGGTGGHVFPALALARGLKTRGGSVRIITDHRGQKYCTDIEYHVLAAKAVLGRGLWQKCIAILSLGLGYFQAHLLLWRYGPENVIGFGGYGSLPMLLAAQHQGRRTIIHEQNAVMGRVNRLLARRAELVALSFATTQKCPADIRSRHIGNPASGAVVSRDGHRRGGEDFHLLVLGGSLGAKIFDTLILEAMQLLPQEYRKRIVLVQQTVAAEPEQLQGAYQEWGVRAQCARFIPEAAKKMLDMDMILTRAGGGITAEVSNASLPALYVPLPIAADQHQYYNARYYADAGGAEILAQDHLSAGVLAEKLQFYLDHPARLVAMSEAMQRCAMPDALEIFTHYVAETKR